MGSINNGTQKVTFSAYVKVESIKGNKSTIDAVVSFTDKDQRFSKQYAIPVSVEDGSPNFIKQAYQYLKTLPEFANAQDC